MPFAGHNPRNPTVEEGDDESNAGWGDRAPKTEQFQHAWPEICTQHDFILSSHLEMLQQLKSQIQPDGQAFQLVSNMLEKTNKLVTQFNILKRQVVPQLNAFNLKSDPSSSETAPGNQGRRSESTSTSSYQAQPPRPGLKRALVNEDESEADVGTAAEIPGTKAPRPVAVPSTRSHKRTRLEKSIPGADEDAMNVTPVSVETEDISEEVQRRLKIKEEQRKKRGTSKADKRKRDSMTSNGSASSPGTITKHARKKAKVGTKRDR
ncbi:uncharacterized protein BO80DRAFT_461855 [Aspergillus ibericus CBS 121593]|uniref:Uncharacterized protein n=1 Tax=Aspergillus ibericus CBS 121593 TaxID=1448316 RepID=A0A395HF06_9EURO|nr:hypothetical protein BO80DRAFT_461855 [Aspergillus ibericus CBS 121593]RAL04814.1 hypothetical protein BO80DRAFT_461855 [Aspergillus ibericus CBS 121593]